MSKVNTFFNSNRFLLLLILLVAALVRFYRFWEIPMTNDELSALSRLRFDNLSELIKYGIMPDGHPAGTQVFLFYWTKWFGLEPFLIKLPFLLLSLFSVLLIYKIGKVWFNPEVGLFASAIAATTQAFVLYGQIARPYSFGLFFTLLAVYFWSLYFFKRRSLALLIGYIFSAALATYMHHFALLFIAILGFTGFFYLRKRELKPYLLANLMVFLLYVPHLPIFFAQLKIGGIGGPGNWLNAPAPSFLYDYLSWVFHYSFWFFGAVLLSIIIGGIFVLSKNAQDDFALKKRITLFLWFTIPLFIGYGYSVWVNPVLRFSVLLFSLPYLFLLLFSFVAKLKSTLKIILLFLLLATSLYSLVLERKHFTVFYAQPAHQIVKHAIRHQKLESVFILANIQPYFLDYHLDIFKQEIPYYSFYNEQLSPIQIDSLAKTVKEDALIVSGLNPYQQRIVRKYFPYFVKQEKGFTYEMSVFSKTDKYPPPPKVYPINSLDLVDGNAKWKYKKECLKRDSLSGDTILIVEAENTWPLAFRDSLKNLVSTKLKHLEVEYNLKSNDSLLELVLVMELKKGEELIAWRGLNTKDYPLRLNKWNRIYLSIDLQEAIPLEENFQNLIFNTYLWNQSQNSFEVINSHIRVFEGNPFRYALFSKIDE